ncbi:MAG: aminoacyl-tRNA hydrolase [Bacteroidaceae bacterium]|nr:aminoacyl-tRNA hydrolase [Bacteroidaceae bacterium]
MNNLIVGLGNIGDEYDGTRHNMGFRILDALAQASNIVFDDKRYGFIAETKVKNQNLILLKPSTYMNNSGNAVRYWMNKKNIELDRLLVVSDDIALPFGTLRMKPGGSEGGHNGLRSITSCIGTNQYARLRFGVGSDFPYGSQIDWVLGKFFDDELQKMDERVETAQKMIITFCLAGVQAAMNQFNGK